MIIKFIAAVAQLAEASGLGPEGWGFDSLQRHQLQAGVAQLVRAVACQATGREFESHLPLQLK